jgi:recombination protein RecA
MPSASAIRFQIEASLAHRIPSALTPVPRLVRPVVSTGVASVDKLLEGGLPVGAITEYAGPECSGRTSLALSFLAKITETGRVGAWVDVCDALHPESAAAAGIDLSRLLWVRCGVAARRIQAPAVHRVHLPEPGASPQPSIKGLYGRGCGGHPRSEVNGLPQAVGEFFRGESFAPRCAEPQRRLVEKREAVAHVSTPHAKANSHGQPVKPWARMEQGLRVADLLLNAGGFAAIVFDMSGIAPEYASRVPLSTWFRYRAAAEKAQTIVLLLTQHPCARSSGELLLRFCQGDACSDELTVFTGVQHRVTVERRRFAVESPANVVPIQKLPQRETSVNWSNRCTWAGAR